MGISPLGKPLAQLKKAGCYQGGGGLGLRRRAGHMVLGTFQSLPLAKAWPSGLGREWFLAGGCRAGVRVCEA